MPARIVVKEATREQTFELLSPSTVLGREPGCDIQLLDLKLSRRHAQLDVTPQGVKLIDLGSRNGTFVNGRQVHEVWLNHGDEIQIGHVKITLLLAQEAEESTQEVPPPSATGKSLNARTVTTSTPAPGESRTSPTAPPAPAAPPAVGPDVFEPSPPPSAAPSPPAPPVSAEPEESKTVFLDAQRLQQVSQTPIPPAAFPPQGEDSTARMPVMAGDSKTVFLDAQRMQEVSQQPIPPGPLPAPPGVESTTRLTAVQGAVMPLQPERGTQLIGGMPGAGRDQTVFLGGASGGATRVGAQTGPSREEHLFSPVMEHVQKRFVSKIRFPRMNWRTKFVSLLSMMLIFLLLVILLPLLKIQQKAVVRASLERGLALADSLAARNYFPVVNNQRLQLDTDFITREAGVKQGVILDARGQVLSPAARAGEIVARIEGVDKNTAQIKLLEEGVTASGDYNLVLPIKNDNAQIVGYAWLTFTPSGLSESFGNIVVVVMLVVFLAAIGGAALVWSATNMTVRPLEFLRDETESAIRGDINRIESEVGFAEINALAQSINRLIDRAAVAPEAPVATPVQTPPPVSYHAAVAVASGFPQPAPAPGIPFQPAPAPFTSSAPAAPAIPTAGSEAGELVVDGNFTIMQARGSVSKWLGMSTQELQGKHVIEGIREQPLLEVILDLINALATQPQATQEVDFSAIPSLGGPFMLVASKLAAGDQISIRLTKK